MLARSISLHRNNFLLSTTRALSSKPISKVYPSVESALEDVKDDSIMAFGGFGVCGIPENFIEGLIKKGTKNIFAVSNDCGTIDFGLGKLLTTGQITGFAGSYVGENKMVASLYQAGKLELHLIPQGTLAEKLRAGGAGIGAFYTPSGYGTLIQEGGMVLKYNENGEPAKVSLKKEIKVFNGKPMVLEETISTDYSFIKGWRADTAGNVQFKGTSLNFNPDCAKSAKVSMVEVEEIVPVGTFKPEEIQLPGIYVDRIIKGPHFEKRIAKPMFAKEIEAGSDKIDESKLTPRDRIAQRAARELQNGDYVNLGIGIPTLVPNFVPKGVTVTLQSENGLLGTGPYPKKGQEDPDLINAGKEPVTYLPDSVVFPSSESFAMIRGKHIDITCLGALEVSQNGDLASWIVPGAAVKGPGGAMDLVSACEKIIVTTMHVGKDGSPKILKKCNLPITGKCVADLIISDLAVFENDRKNGGGLTLIEIAPGITLEELRQKTEADYKVSPNLKPMW